ncbi:hypothetical protein EJB05_38705 [Eragrostis curvula]|uniref:Uncharacterized protein n=1 Tax=Eragrostis curvula TaxID=38414 RepID=A0A5J9TWI2_9POAL|nr:hypothetical protein EJB05_38705 [Eragrostis curvula]
MDAGVKPSRFIMDMSCCARSYSSTPVHAQVIYSVPLLLKTCNLKDPTQEGGLKFRKKYDENSGQLRPHRVMAADIGYLARVIEGGI